MMLGKSHVGLRAIATLAASSLLLAAGCATGGPAASGSDPAAANLNVTWMPKNLGNPYFDTMFKGIQTGMSAVGGTVTQVAPAKGDDPAGQVPYINTATQQQVDALIVSANDPSAICDAMKEAMNAGVKVITSDADTNPDCRQLFINQATAEGLGKVQIDIVAEQIGDEGEIAILSATANATNQNAWIAEMKNALAAHPNIKLVDTVYGDDDDQKSFDKTAGLLQAHPNLKAIISPTTVGIAAAARYLSTSSSKGKVVLTGLGTPNQLRKYVMDGTVTEFALWNPEELGVLTAYATAALAKGEISGNEGDKFTAGDLGEFTVGANNTVLLGEPYRFNKDNIDQFNF